MRTLCRHLSLLTCDDDRRVIPDAAIVTHDDTIVWVGAASDVPDDCGADRTIELAGRWVTPGLIDCHTHLVFAGQRAAEFARRTAGTSYADIAREGGGILNTVRATRGATVDALVQQSAPRLRALLQEGVTTVEIKSGYGLEFESEQRMLLAARELERRLPVSVVTSLLAAHATPPEFAGRRTSTSTRSATTGCRASRAKRALTATLSRLRGRGSRAPSRRRGSEGW